jgi:mitogen-activated protein kinase kinase 1
MPGNSLRKPRGLSLNVTPNLEREESFDLGDTTFRQDEVAINRQGLLIDGKQGIRDDVDPADITHGKTIGRGCSSYVQLCEHKSSGNLLALKVINLYDKDKRHQMMEEIKLLYYADCPSLIKFHGAFFKDSAISICLEYMDLGSLHDVINKFGKIPERVLAHVTYQILWGLAYLKYENRFHRDIKPANILANSLGQVKLTDFGIAREMESSMAMANTFVGTFKYMSPERIQSQPYNFKSDIWSLGLVLIELATTRYPYSESRAHIEMVQTILDSPEPNVDSSYTTEFREFLGHCLKKEASERLPADILLASPWLEQNGAINIDTATATVREWFSQQSFEGDESKFAHK